MEYSLAKRTIVRCLHSKVTNNSTARKLDAALTITNKGTKSTSGPLTYGLFKNVERHKTAINIDRRNFL